MSEHLYKNLRKIGIEDPVAYEVSNAMNPERYATRHDMMEAIAANRENTMAEVRAIEKRQAAQREETLALIAANREESKEALHKMNMNLTKAVADLRVEMRSVVADVRAEMRTIGRQYWITLVALLTTIGIAVACNLPGHWKNFSQTTHSPYRHVQQPTGRLAQPECPVCWLWPHTRGAGQQIQSTD